MPPDPSRIIDLANAFYGSCVLFAASDAGVFGALSQLGSADADTVADKLSLNRRGVRLLLDACVAIQLLEKTDGLYRNSPESGAFLVPDVPGSLAGAIRYSRDVYPAWGRLPELIAAGRPWKGPKSTSERMRTAHAPLSFPCTNGPWASAGPLFRSLTWRAGSSCLISGADRERIRFFWLRRIPTFYAR